MIGKRSNLVFSNWKLMIAVLMLSCLVFAIAVVKMHKTVVIAWDGNQKEIKTFANTVQEVLTQQGIQVDPEDWVEPQLETKLQEGTQILVERAFPVTLIIGETEQKVQTVAENGEALLQSLGIQLSELDRVEPAVTTPLKAGAVIKITQVEEEILTEEMEIPYQTLVKYSEALEHGKTKILQNGQGGTKEITYKITYEDGIEVAREVVSEEVHQEAVNEIVEKGTLNYIVTSRGELTRYAKTMTVVATAYDAGYASTGKNPGDPYYGITSSGTQVRPGVVAVDPSVIPLGTKLYIESLDGQTSYGYFVAEDTGSAIKGNKIDIYYESRSEALRFGRKTLRVYVLE